MVRSRNLPRLGSRPQHPSEIVLPVRPLNGLPTNWQRCFLAHVGPQKAPLTDVDFERCLHLAQMPLWVYDSVSLLEVI